MYYKYIISCTAIMIYHVLQLWYTVYYNYGPQWSILILYMVVWTINVHLCNICDIFAHANDVQYL